MMISVVKTASSNSCGGGGSRVIGKSTLNGPMSDCTLRMPYTINNCAFHEMHGGCTANCTGKDHVVTPHQKAGPCQRVRDNHMTISNAIAAAAAASTLMRCLHPVLEKYCEHLLSNRGSKRSSGRKSRPQNNDMHIIKNPPTTTTSTTPSQRKRLRPIV